MENSAKNLPIDTEKCENHFGVSQFVCGFGIPVETETYESITSGIVFKSQLPLPAKASDLRTHTTHNVNGGRKMKSGKNIYMDMRWELYKALELWANRVKMKYYSCLKFLTILMFCNILEQGLSISMTNDRLSTMKYLHRKKRQLPLVFDDSSLFYFICGFGIPVDTDIDYESITSGVEFIAQLPQLPSKPSDLRTPSFYTINAGRAWNKGKDLNTQIRWEFYKALEVWANSIGLNGQSCVLKTLCEVTQIPFDNDLGDLWHEIAHILFTPSLSTDDLSHPLSQKYLAAAKTGLNNDCSSVFKECPKSLLNIFTNIF
ncbi:hypothetical protein DOY81_002346 [Sarcophaga bullata]|nr:hypothetical protein DOY81_002346 [Sarcophaga bullata]